MKLTRLILFALFIASVTCKATGANFVVADSLTRQPLTGVVIFDRDGTVLGTTNAKGITPYIPSSSYPSTMRLLGYIERTVSAPRSDTVFLKEKLKLLPEVVVESRQLKVLHILGYVREYSTLSTYTDTVRLFREKMIDFMLTPGQKMRFKGWKYPRVLKSKSYYHFTNTEGLDSVSDANNNHFSWSDWVGLPAVAAEKYRMGRQETAADTIRGRYGNAEIWRRSDDRLTIDIDILADSTCRRWVPELEGFFRRGIDFERFSLRYTYDNPSDNELKPIDLSGYSFNIESRGRGRDMFRFNRVDEPFFVNSYTEVYLLDKEFVSVKEAKKWAELSLDSDDIAIMEPADAPELQPSTLNLIARVDAIDRNEVRLGVEPDMKLMSTLDGARNFKIGRRALNMLKQLTGISFIKAHKNFDRNWKGFRQSH